jgi:hypothetical protein
VGSEAVGSSGAHSSGLRTISFDHIHLRCGNSKTAGEVRTEALGVPVKRTFLACGATFETTFRNAKRCPTCQRQRGRPQKSASPAPRAIHIPTKGFVRPLLHSYLFPEGGEPYYIVLLELIVLLARLVPNRKAGQAVYFQRGLDGSDGWLLE